MTTPVLGEFLAAAASQIDQAVTCPVPADDLGKAAAITQLDRLASTLARYAATVTIISEPDPEDTSLTGIRQARASTRIALQHAADSTRRAAAVTATRESAAARSAVRHLSLAADHLAAGCDLLQTHFTTSPTGLQTGISRWAELIWSPPTATIVLSALAGYARQLAPWTAQLSLTGPPETTLPPLACVAAHTASRWLWTAGTAMTTELTRHPAVADRMLALTIPANFPPPRHPPGTSQTISDLCADTAVTAQRLRHLPLAIPGTLPPRSPATTATSWRRSALAAAIITHTTQLLLTTLARRADQLAPGSTLHDVLTQAASTAGQAWPAWRTVAQGLDLVRTGDNRDTPSPITADLTDLTLWIGRLAYDHPGWTPAISNAAALRTPQDLAPQPAEIATVLAAVHHATDAVLQAVPPDKDALIDTAARRRLFIRTRLLSARDDIPYRYGRVPPAQIDDLLTAYITATQATQRTLTCLDHLATTLDAATSYLAATRPHQPAVAAQTKGRKHPLRPADQQALVTPLPESGHVEQALRALDITEPAMLNQAAAIDTATQRLINQATAKNHRRTITTGAQPAHRPDRTPRRPPETARMDSPEPPITHKALTRPTNPGTSISPKLKKPLRAHGRQP